jgi:hypothetical protein
MLYAIRNVNYSLLHDFKLLFEFNLILVPGKNNIMGITPRSALELLISLRISIYQTML